MKVEEICMRQEIRQLMSECGFTRDTIKELVKEAIEAEAKKQVERRFEELKNCGAIDKELKEEVRKVGYGSITNEVQNQIKRMKMNVDIQIGEMTKALDKEIEERNEGKILTYDKYPVPIYECLSCKTPLMKFWKYCPNCGNNIEERKDESNN